MVGPGYVNSIRILGFASTFKPLLIIKFRLSTLRLCMMINYLPARRLVTNQFTASVFLRCYALKILNDETDFKAILPKGE